MATNNLLLLLIINLVSLCYLAQGRGARAPHTVFNVLKYGAKPNGMTDSTEAFHSAWREACSFPGNPRLLVPAGTFLVGRTVFAGPCSSRITVQMMGTIRAPADPNRYADAEWFTFEKINGLILNGRGTFDGQGPAVWGKHGCTGSSSQCGGVRAVNLKFRNVTNAKLGHFTSLNPKGFHLCINHCHKFVAKKLRIIAPDDSPNTDGIHVSSSSDVTITKSIIATGDDCVSLIQGDTRITVSDVMCGPGHGISIGSLGNYKEEKEVHDVFVRNCTLRNSDNGVRIKTWRGSPASSASNINFEDIIMENVQNPIIIDQEYCGGKVNCRGNLPSKVKLSNINFKNIRGTSRSKTAVKMKCSPEVPCENVRTSNIHLVRNDGTPATSECANIKVNAAGVQVPPACV